MNVYFCAVYIVVGAAVDFFSFFILFFRFLFWLNVSGSVAIPTLSLSALFYKTYLFFFYFFFFKAYNIRLAQNPNTKGVGESMLV